MTNRYLPGVIQIPSSLLITAATTSYPMVITVAVGNASSEFNTYIVGMNVKMTVPKSYGMFQANNLVGTILEISGSDFSLNIDSSLFDIFSIPSGNVQAPASIAPFGSKNLEYNNTTNQVPFQSLNNRGN
jgi:hypothetical protein